MTSTSPQAPPSIPNDCARPHAPRGGRLPRDLWPRADVVAAAVGRARGSGREDHWVSAMKVLAEISLAERLPVERAGVELVRLGVDFQSLPARAAHALAERLLAAEADEGASPDMCSRDKLLCLQAWIRAKSRASEWGPLTHFERSARRSEARARAELEFVVARQAVAERQDRERSAAERAGIPQPSPEMGRLRDSLAAARQTDSQAAWASAAESMAAIAVESMAAIAVGARNPARVAGLLIATLDVDLDAMPHSAARALALTVQNEEALRPAPLFPMEPDPKTARARRKAQELWERVLARSG